ncbi:DUF3494 domain-containing protein [Patescibacteria group bacterium]|nr:DUF3494 domain-containing protein [Patescibacteria group bacterium]
MINLNKKAVVAALVVSFGILSALPVLAAGPAAINLGTAGNFVILSKTGVSTTGTTAVTGDIGVSPVSATSITGFSLILPAGGAYSTSQLVTGKVYAPGYADPTSANLTTAIGDMQTAYTDGQGRSNPTATELGTGNIGGMTLAPGLYKWGTGVTIPSNLTLSGSANDVWIFQIAQGLNVASGVNVVLTGGAQASNVFWVVAGQVTVGTTASLKGNILGQTAIIFNTGASLSGRALAQTAVTLDSNSIVTSGAASAVVTPTPTPVATSTPTTTATSTPATTTTSTSGTTATTTSSSTSTATVASNSQATPAEASALQAQINALAGQISQRMSQMSVQSSTSVNFGQQVKAIVTNQFKGNRNSNVKVLQDFLISQNKGVAARALANNGSTTYFGELTKAALAEFQASVGISPAAGYFGAITRAYISANF